MLRRGMKGGAERGEGRKKIGKEQGRRGEGRKKSKCTVVLSAKRV